MATTTATTNKAYPRKYGDTIPTAEASALPDGAKGVRVSGWIVDLSYRYKAMHGVIYDSTGSLYFELKNDEDSFEKFKNKADIGMYFVLEGVMGNRNGIRVLYVKTFAYASSLTQGVLAKAEAAVKNLAADLKYMEETEEIREWEANSSGPDGRSWQTLAMKPSNPVILINLQKPVGYDKPMPHVKDVVREARKKIGFVAEPEQPLTMYCLAKEKRVSKFNTVAANGHKYPMTSTNLFYWYTDGFNVNDWDALGQLTENLPTAEDGVKRLGVYDTFGYKREFAYTHEVELDL